jgi:hypothetical protein
MERRGRVEETVDVVEVMTTKDLHGYVDWTVFSHTDLSDGNGRLTAEKTALRGRRGPLRNVIHFCGGGRYGRGVWVVSDPLREKKPNGCCNRCGMAIPEHVDTLARLSEEK